MRVGTCSFATTSEFHPHTVVPGARRTPWPQVAPTGSDSSIFDHIVSLTAGSYWSAHPTCRSQFAVKSSRDCLFMATPSAGSFTGGLLDAVRLNAGASRTSLSTFSGCRDANPPERGAPSDQAIK